MAVFGDVGIDRKPVVATMYNKKEVNMNLDELAQALAEMSSDDRDILYSKVEEIFMKNLSIFGHKLDQVSEGTWIYKNFFVQQTAAECFFAAMSIKDVTFSSSSHKCPFAAIEDLEGRVTRFLTEAVNLCNLTLVCEKETPIPLQERKSLAWNPSTPATTLTKLAEDPDWHVRTGVAGNPNYKKEEEHETRTGALAPWGGAWFPTT